MLYLLLDRLADNLSFLNVFRYLTFRAILGAVTALSVALVAGPRVIAQLNRHRVAEQIRDDGPQSHLQKAGTPTMGGALILLAMLVSTLLWADLRNHYIWLLLVTTLAFGLVGLIDDYRKLRHGKGLAARSKLAWQTAIAVGVACFLYWRASDAAQLAYLVPFLKSVSINLGIGFIPFTALVVVGTSNAVNLTDGLDGLAILPSVLVAGALAIFAYVAGNHVFAGYLQIPYLPGVGESAIFCGSLVGAGLGFLWFNTYPAQVFMGDVGALAVGAALGLVAVLVRQEIVLAIMGGVFVIEAVSVMLQVVSFKLTGRRVFQMAPLHHHFELKGWPEPRVIVRFWIITFVLVLFGLATLKLR